MSFFLVRQVDLPKKSLIGKRTENFPNLRPKSSVIAVCAHLFCSHCFWFVPGSVRVPHHGDPFGSSSEHHHLPAGTTSPSPRPWHEMASHPSVGCGGGGDRGLLFFSNAVSIFRRNFSSINGIDAGIPNGRGRCHDIACNVGRDVPVILVLYCPDRGK